MTYNEVSELLAAAVAAGNVNAAGNVALSSRLASAKAEFDAGNYKRAIGYLDQFVAQTKKPVNCRSAATGSLPRRGRRARQARGQGRRAQQLGGRLHRRGRRFAEPPEAGPATVACRASLDVGRRRTGACRLWTNRHAIGTRASHTRADFRDTLTAGGGWS